MKLLPHLVVLLAFLVACGSSSENASEEELLGEAHQADCGMACTSLGDCGKVDDVDCSTDCILELRYGDLDECTACISANGANESCDPCLAACNLLLD